MKFSLIFILIATLVLVVTADRACDDEAFKSSKEILCLDKPLKKQIRKCKDNVTRLSFYNISRQRCGNATLSAEEFKKIDTCISTAKAGLSTEFLNECSKKANSALQVRNDLFKD